MTANNESKRVRTSNLVAENHRLREQVRVKDEALQKIAKMPDLPNPERDADWKNCMKWASYYAHEALTAAERELKTITNEEINAVACALVRVNDSIEPMQFLNECEEDGDVLDLLQKQSLFRGYREAAKEILYSLGKARAAIDKPKRVGEEIDRLLDSIEDAFAEFGDAPQYLASIVGEYIGLYRHHRALLKSMEQQGCKLKTDDEDRYFQTFNED